MWWIQIDIDADVDTDIGIDIDIDIHNGLLLVDEKESHLAICNNMDGTRVYYAKRNKSGRETQIPYDFTHVELRNSTDEHRDREGKIQYKKRGKETIRDS